MQNAKWLPSARITNSRDFDHLQGLHALLEFRILRSETSSGFLRQPTMVTKMLLQNSAWT